MGYRDQPAQDTAGGVAAAGLAIASPRGASGGRDLPSPEDFFGFVPGREGRLADWAGLVAYFRALAAASPQVRLLQFGTSTEGRPLVALACSAPSRLEQLEALGARQRQRARTGEGGALPAAPVVLCMTGVHAAEWAGPQGAADLAFALAGGLRRTLDRLLVLLLPALDPDGLDAVCAWQAGPGSGHAGVAPPGLCRRYAGHDINRDWIMQTQAEVAAAVAGLQLRFVPHVVLDLHEMWPHGARMFLPPYAPPADPAADPAVVARAGALGAAMAQRLRAEGLEGIVSGVLFDAFSPARAFSHYHGGVRILCETAAPGALPEASGAASGQYWTAADVQRYQRAAVLACLHTVAAGAAGWDRWQGEVLRRSREGPDRAGWYVLNADQADAGAAAELARVLRAGGLDLSPLPGGGLAVPRAQAYGRWADTLLAATPYPRPRGGTPPYDVTAHLLPELMGIACRRRETPAADAAPPRPAGAAPWPAADTSSYAAVLARLAAGAPLWRVEGAEGRPAGFAAAASAEALPAEWRQAATPLSPPRVGVYGSWRPSSDEGWLRYLLDRFGQPFTALRDAELREGVPSWCTHLILPSLRGRDLVHGLPEDRYPAACAGGLGPRGRAALQRWVAGGGRLLAVEWAAAWVHAAFGLTVPDVAAQRRDAPLPPGALLPVAPGASPLAFGAPARSSVLYRGGPALRVESPAAAFTGEPPAAGLADGAAALAGAAAVAELPYGRGSCRLFAFSPYFRAQSWASFRWLFNALLC